MEAISQTMTPFGVYAPESRRLRCRPGMLCTLSNILTAALVRNLVELHGGSVTAASAGIGQGSEFTVRLPTASP